MRTKLEREVQQALREPAKRPLPADPFEGFREPMFDSPLPYEGKGHVNRAAIQRSINRRAERKLAALVQACHEAHYRR